MSKKTVIRSFQFRSSSNPSLIHTTLLYADGSASCNCKGWANHVASDGSRNCKHLIAAGIRPVGETKVMPPLVSLAKAKTHAAKHGAPAPVSKGIARRMNFDED